MSDRQVYRLAGVSYAFDRWASAVTAVGGGLGFLLWLLFGPGGGAEGGAWFWPAEIFVLSLGLVVGGVRLARQGVEITNDAVVVRGLVRTRRVQLGDVDRFAMSGTWPVGTRRRWWMSGQSISLRPWGMGELWLRSGERHWLWHVAKRSATDRAPEDLIERLNQDLEDRRARSMA